MTTQICFARLGGVAILLLLLGSVSCGPESRDLDVSTDDTGSGGDSDTTTETASESGTDSDSDTESETGPELEIDTDTDYDCGDLPAGPFPAVQVPNSLAGEDFTFDDVGNLVTIDGMGMFKIPYGGTPELFISGISYDSGIEYLPDGNLVVADNCGGTINVINDLGESSPVMTGLSWPNGIAVHPSGQIYFTDLSEGKVHRLDPGSGDNELVADGFDRPDGITFGQTYHTLYVGELETGRIYIIPVDDDGNTGDPVVWVDSVGAIIDGMGVDACGNVYVCAIEEGQVFRISSGGGSIEPLIEDSDLPMTTNLNWGSGINGWKFKSLFISDRNVAWEINLGVPSKPAPF